MKSIADRLKHVYRGYRTFGLGMPYATLQVIDHIYYTEESNTKEAVKLVLMFTSLLPSVWVGFACATIHAHHSLSVQNGCNCGLDEVYERLQEVES